MQAQDQLHAQETHVIPLASGVDESAQKSDILYSKSW